MNQDVGREQISKDGMSRLSDPTFVNNDYVTAEIIYSTVHAHHEVFTWSWVICVWYVYMSSTKKKVVALLLHHGCVLWVSHERRKYSMSTVMVAVSARRE